MSTIARLVAFSSLLVGLQAQEIGVSTCACQPSTYTFQLNFDLICADRDVEAGDPGIVDSACVRNTQGNENVTDLVPVRVSEVQILELDQSLDVIFQTTLTDNFVNGASFNYSSVTQTMPTMLNATSIPKGIQVFLTGRNAAEQDIVNFWAIVYDNDCGVFPLLTVGQQIGWTTFTGLGSPPQFLCPAVGPPPTEAPVMTPAPTAATEAPTEAPTTGVTTEAPTSTPQTEAPTEAPTEEPTEEPTPPPTVGTTTEAPTSATETEAPTSPPITEAPTSPQTTRAPTTPPITEAPTSPQETEAPTTVPRTSAPTMIDTSEPPTLPEMTDAPTILSMTGEPTIVAAPASVPGCPPIHAPTMVSGSTSATSGSSGFRGRRQLKVDQGTASPTACPEPDSVPHPSPVAAQPVAPHSSAKGSKKALPKKKEEKPKRAKTGMQKLTKGMMHKISAGSSSVNESGVSSSSYSSKGARRRFLMESRHMF